jgi:class III poly(R)-hydroxyalkanoic acid synthase PhaE subunit
MDTSMSESPFWNDDWMRTQQKYWEQWSDMSRKAMGMQEPPQSPWESALEHWWQAISPSAPEATRGFMDKMLQQGKLFFRLGEEMQANLDKTQDWSEALNQAFENIQESMAAGAEQSAEASEKGFSQWMGFWEGPIESWRKAAGQLPLNSDFAGTPNLFEQVLGMPGLGFTREDEERYKALGQSWLHYQHALMRYQHFFADLGSASVRCMKGKLKTLADDGQKIESTRALYDLWVAACEEEYAKHAMTPAYAKVYGELVNSLMAFKKQWRELVDERLGVVGMPTTREVRTLQTRLQESRREMRAMRSELDQLKEQVAQLRTREATPAPRKKAASKKTVAKMAPARKVTKKKAVSKKASSK